MLKSTVLIESYLDRLIAKAVNEDYTDILKAIKFNAKDWRRIDSEARKLWEKHNKDNPNERKFLSTWVKEILQREYPDEQVQNVIWPEGTMDRQEEAEHGRYLDREELDAERERAFDAETGGVIYQPQKNPKFAGIHNPSDDLRYRQFKEFGDKLISDAYSRASKKDIRERQEEEKRKKTLRERKEKKGEKERALREEEWKEQLSNMPKTEKLFNEWAESTDSAKLIELLDLVGSLKTPNKKEAIGRLERFINEKIVEEDDKKALTTILETMKEEFAEEERKRISTAGRTATYLEARAIGATLGSKPNNKKGKVKGTKISKTGLHTIRWGNFTNDNSKITRKGVEFLKEDAPMDLSQERWLNDPLLSDYAEYRIQEIEPEMTIPNFRNSENKDEIISQVKRKQPKLPEPSNTLVTMMGIWNEVGDNIEDFPYFLQGWKNAVITGFVEIATDEIMVLFDFSNKVLPKLVNAINKGVILNPNTGEVSFDNIIRNYKRAINQIPRGLRSSIITTVFNIAQGNRVSSDKKGKTKQQLQKAEDVIINQLQEEVPNTNKTYAHFILENHLKINRRKKGGSILVDLLKTIEEEEGEIEYLEQPKPVSTEKPVSRRGPQRKPVASDKFGSTSQIAGSKFQELRERLEPADADIDAPYKGEYEFPQRGTDKEVDMKVGSRPDGTRVPKHSKLSETEWRKKLSEDGKSQEEIDSIIGYNEKGERVKKSLETLLDMINESDDIIFKEDVGLILESLNAKQKKKLKTILNVADPTEYFGHDFLKLEELIKVLKTLGVVKGDKKLNKKILRYEDKNLKVVKLATRLRKDYENLYRGLRELIYPKTGDNK